MVILFLSFFAAFGIVFLVVRVDSGNSRSNPYSPVVVDTLVAVLNLHCLIPLSVFLHQKNFENGLSVKGWGSRELSMTQIWDP